MLEVVQALEAAFRIGARAAGAKEVQLRELAVTEVIHHLGAAGDAVKDEGLKASIARSRALWEAIEVTAAQYPVTVLINSGVVQGLLIVAEEMAGRERRIILPGE